MRILEKMRDWKTWKAIVKDLEPYLKDIFTKLDNHDHSVKKELDTLKKIIPVVKAAYDKASKESIAPSNAYCAAMNKIYELYVNSDNLKDLLESQTMISDTEKEWILTKWENHESSKWKPTFSVEDTKAMEECLRANCAELSKASVKMKKITPFRETMTEVFYRTMIAKNMIEGGSSFSKESSSSRKDEEKKPRSQKK